jgi:hypothetical protein
MINRASLRRMLACCRIALGNLCLLAILLATGPLLNSESTESNTPTESKEACAEFVVGIQQRLVKVRMHWTTADFMPTDDGYLPPKRQVPMPSVGHFLSHELLAPIRC